MRNLSRTVAALVAVTVGSASAGVNAAPSRRASLTVDTSDLGETGPIVKRRIQERGNIVMRDRSIVPGTSDADPEIVVTVEDATGEEPGYTLRLRIELSEGKGPSRTALCKLCTESELVAMAESELVVLLAELPEASDPSQTTAPKSDPDPVLPPDQTRPPGKLGPMGKSGAALIAVGGAAVVTGSILAALPPEPLPEDPLKVRDTAPAGFVTLGLGAAVAFTGVVLLAIDVTRSKHRTSARAHVVPSVGGFAIRF